MSVSALPNLLDAHMGFISARLSHITALSSGLPTSAGIVMLAEYSVTPPSACFESSPHAVSLSSSYSRSIKVIFFGSADLVFILATTVSPLTKLVIGLPFTSKYAILPYSVSTARAEPHSSAATAPIAAIANAAFFIRLIL